MANDSQKSFEQFQYALHHQHNSYMNSSTSLIMELMHIRISNIRYIRVHSNFKVHLFTALYTSSSFHVNLLQIEIMMKCYNIADTILHCSTDCVSLNWVLIHNLHISCMINTADINKVWNLSQTFSTARRFLNKKGLLCKWLVTLGHLIQKLNLWHKILLQTHNQI
jgi:hypothetical protein